MSRLVKHQNVVVAALVAAVAAAMLASNAAWAAPGGANNDDNASAAAPEARAASYAADRRPAPHAVREWAAAWNDGSPERIADLLTEDGVYEDHAFQVEVRGKDGIA
jgi:hypothetical protein